MRGHNSHIPEPDWDVVVCPECGGDLYVALNRTAGTPGYGRCEECSVEVVA